MTEVGTQNLEPVSSDLLWQALNMQKVCKHVSQMLHIGTVLNQESGFVVYERPEGLKVSKLLVPKVEEVSDEPWTYEQAGSINLDPLVRIKLDLASSTEEDRSDPRFEDRLAKEHRDIEQQSLSEEAQQKADGVLADPDLDEEDKERIIEKIKENEYRRIHRRGLNIRNDLLITAHNHPIFPAFIYNIDSLMRPSTGDVLVYDRRHQASPRNVSFIVSSDGKQHRATLIGAGLTAKTRPEMYAGRVEAETRVSLGRCLAALAASGFRSVIIDIEDNGAPNPDSRAEVDAFTAALATDS